MKETACPAFIAGACPVEWQGGCYRFFLEFLASIPIVRELLSFFQEKESDIQGVQQNTN